MLESNNTSEKIIKLNKKSFNGRLKKIKGRIIPSINRILDKDTSMDGTKKGYEIFFKYIKNEIKNGANNKDSEHIAEIFNTINRLTSDLNTKKLYVSYPQKKLAEYDELNLINKLKDIVIPKTEINLSNQEKTSGGNCHNWTLLYKELFDELKIDNQIILFEPETAHSLLLIELNGEYFIADTEGQNKFNFDKINIGDSISIGNHLKAHIKRLNPLKVDISKKNIDIKDNFNPKIYDNKFNFINFIDNKERDYFLLEYNDINKETNEKILKSFMISFSNQKIVLTIEGFFKKNKIISLGIDKIPTNANLSNMEIIKYIIRRTNNQIFKDEKIGKELKGIISKIPEYFIQSKI